MRHVMKSRSNVTSETALSIATRLTMGNAISRSHRYGDRAMKHAGVEADGDHGSVHLHMAQFRVAFLVAGKRPMLVGDHAAAIAHV